MPYSQSRNKGPCVDNRPGGQDYIYCISGKHGGISRREFKDYQPYAFV